MYNSRYKRVVYTIFFLRFVILTNLIDSLESQRNKMQLLKARHNLIMIRGEMWYQIKDSITYVSLTTICENNVSFK